MAIATYTAYKNKVAAKQAPSFFTKASVTFNGINSAWNTAWTSAPDAGVVPTATARVCTSQTLGALLASSQTPLRTPMTAKFWLAQMELQIAAASNRTNSGIFMLVDRMADILPSATANATVTPIANLALTGMVPTRWTTGEGVMAALQCITVIAGAPQLTIGYTNQAGTAGKTSQILVPSASQALSIIPFSLADGDYGLQSIQSYNVTTAGTTGQFGLVLYKPLAIFGMPRSYDNPGYRELLDSGNLCELHPDSCLEIWSYNLATSTASGLIMGNLGIIEG